VADDVRITTTPGADHEDGVTELCHAALGIRVVPRGFLPASEVSFFRCIGGAAAGRPHRAAVADLLAPARLEQRITTAIGPITASHRAAA
jgi:hypothetical protein